jgi:hypothetical protein
MVRVLTIRWSRSGEPGAGLFGMKRVARVFNLSHVAPGFCKGALSVQSNTRHWSGRMQARVGRL